MTPDDEVVLREVVAKGDADPAVWDSARRRGLIAYGPALLALVDSLRSEVEALRGERDAVRSEFALLSRCATRDANELIDARTMLSAAEARADSLAGELATLRAAYEGLREAASELSDIFADGFNAADIDSFTVQPIRIALNAAPASLAGQVKARHYREAAALVRAAEAERCLAWRTPGGPLLNNNVPTCSGYYERGLRCPDCPEESDAASVLDDAAREAEP